MALKYTDTYTHPFSFSTNYKVSINAPIDARSVVDSKAELTKEETWAEVGVYAGMVVATADGELYILKDVSKITTTGWSKLNGGSGSGSLSEAELAKLVNRSEIFTAKAGETTNYYYTYEEYVALDGNSGVTQTEYDALVAAEDASVVKEAVLVYNTVIKPSALGYTGTSTAEDIFDGSVIDSTFLPSYVDDVVEVTLTLGAALDTASATAVYNVEVDGKYMPVTAVMSTDETPVAVTLEKGKIYVDVSTDNITTGKSTANNQYRYTGTQLIKINSGDIETRMTSAETNITNLQNQLTWKAITATA